MKQLLLSIPLTAAALVACADDTGIGTGDQQASTAVTVEEGIPRYATSQAYFDYGLKMANMDPDERKRLEAAEGFTSMQTYAESLLSDIDANEAEIKSRPEVFSFSADTVDDALMVRADIEVPASMAVAANPDGLYYIGDVVYKVNRYNQASVKNGDAETVGRVLSGEVEADGVSAKLFNYGLCVSNLKTAKTASEAKIDYLKGTIQVGNIWTDYWIRVFYRTTDGSDGVVATISIEQRSKNYQKKHKRWREHHLENIYANVSGSISHSSYTNGVGSFILSNYYGSSLVNHSCTQVVKSIFKGESLGDGDTPYFCTLWGAIKASNYRNEIALNELLSNALNQ